MSPTACRDRPLIDAAGVGHRHRRRRPARTAFGGLRGIALSDCHTGNHATPSAAEGAAICDRGQLVTVAVNVSSRPTDRWCGLRRPAVIWALPGRTESSRKCVEPRGSVCTSRIRTEVLAGSRTFHVASSLGGRSTTGTVAPRCSRTVPAGSVRHPDRHVTWGRARTGRRSTCGLLLKPSKAVRQ